MLVTLFFNPSSSVYYSFNQKPRTIVSGRVMKFCWRLKKATLRATCFEITCWGYFFRSTLFFCPNNFLLKLELRQKNTIFKQHRSFHCFILLSLSDIWNLNRCQCKRKTFLDSKLRNSSWNLYWFRKGSRKLNSVRRKY